LSGKKGRGSKGIEEEGEAVYITPNFKKQHPEGSFSGQAPFTSIVWFIGLS